MCETPNMQSNKLKKQHNNKSTQHYNINFFKKTKTNITISQIKHNITIQKQCQHPSCNSNHSQ